MYGEFLETAQIVKENHIDQFIQCCEAAGAGHVTNPGDGKGRNDHFLMVIDRGEVTGTINNAPIRFRGGSLFNIDVNAKVEELSYSKNFHAFVVGVHFHLLHDIFRNRNPFPSPLRIRFSASEVFRDLDAKKIRILGGDCRNLIGSLGNKEHLFAEELNYAQLYILLTDLADIVWGKLKGEKPDHNIKQSRSDTIMLSFIESMSRNIEKEHSVGFYAADLCISRQYLSAVVRKNAGMSINKIISAFRYERAMKYINNPEYSIKQIADRMSFPDQATFGKFFRSHNGMSPSKYRRQMKTSLLTNRA